MPMVESGRSERKLCEDPLARNTLGWILGKHRRYEQSEWTAPDIWEWEDHPEKLPLVIVYSHVEGGSTAHLLESEIDRSRWILGLPEDWDGEGTEAYTESTWQRAVAFLKQQAAHVRECGSELDIPRILPGPEGSIDLHWEKPDYELLINIPRDPQRRATFYGDDRVSLQIKGTLDTSTLNLGLIEWLVSRKIGR